MTAYKVDWWKSLPLAWSQLATSEGKIVEKEADNEHEIWCSSLDPWPCSCDCRDEK